MTRYAVTVGTTSESKIKTGRLYGTNVTLITTTSDMWSVWRVGADIGQGK
ncbi:MAG: hypothetical protein LUH55_00765 [Bacteroides thetaiotaomicron]|nr:hypothetical protein [Bacteroides thetaiotaomicron]